MTVKESFNVVAVDHVWQSAVEGDVDRRTRCVEFAPDSSLEQRGFELAVPPRPAPGATTSELHPGHCSGDQRSAIRAVKDLSMP